MAWDKREIAGLGIVCITILQAAAMVSGHDGQFFGIVVAAIGTIVGMCFGIGLQQKIDAKKVEQ